MWFVEYSDAFGKLWAHEGSVVFPPFGLASSHRVVGAHQPSIADSLSAATISGAALSARAFTPESASAVLAS
jgi:hypothetical protein